MEVRLAGHNLDRDLLLEIRAALQAAARQPEGLSPEVDRVRASASRLIAKDNWTPETLSAAYARISRDPRPVGELRAIAREEVDAARRSNRAIIFDLGHTSVAEHAVVNLDIIGISRLAVEEVERMRLCSYTEKSQRYILLEEDFIVPKEIQAAGLEEDFHSLVRRQNAFYRAAYDRLHSWVLAQNPHLAGSKRNHRMLEGLAKEDARYGLSLATTVQLGETLNARSVESLIGRTAAHPLAELQEFSRRLHEAVAGLAPSVIKYTGPPEFLVRTPSELRSAVAPLMEGAPQPSGEEVVLLDAPEDAEVRIVATLMHSFCAHDAQTCRQRARAIGPQGRLAVLQAALRHLGPHDPVLREFEHAQLCFELVLSAACFGQLKRHRMATLTAQDYDPGLGVTVPPSFEATALTESFEELRRETESLYVRVRERTDPQAAAYVLLNAHRRRVLWGLNVRELYHVARLRLDEHAQWDIRRLAGRAVDLARERIPGLLLLACGKDRFDERRREVFGPRD